MTIRTKENIRSGIYETFEKKLENNQWRGVLKKEASTFDVQKDDVDASVDTILAATEKILAINRGVAQPDERDSLRFRRLYPMDRLISERIALDADKLFLKTMRRVIRQKSLKPINVNHFNNTKIQNRASYCYRSILFSFFFDFFCFLLCY